MYKHRDFYAKQIINHNIYLHYNYSFSNANNDSS